MVTHDLAMVATAHVKKAQVLPYLGFALTLLVIATCAISPPCTEEEEEVGAVNGAIAVEVFGAVIGVGALTPRAKQHQEVRAVNHAVAVEIRRHRAIIGAFSFELVAACVVVAAGDVVGAVVAELGVADGGGWAVVVDERAAGPSCGIAGKG
jgi:hypothetical protein